MGVEGTARIAVNVLEIMGSHIESGLTGKVGDTSVFNGGALLCECEVWFSKLGFSKENRLNGIVTFTSKEIGGIGEEMLVIKFHVWEGYSQVEMWSRSRGGKERKNKDLIWGWVTNSFDDVKILFSYQVDLRLLAAVDSC